MDQDAMALTITVKTVCKGCQSAIKEKTNENEVLKCILEQVERQLKHVSMKLKHTKEELKEERIKRETAEKENERLTDQEVNRASTSVVTRYNKIN